MNILKKLIIILTSSLGFYFSAQEELTIIRSLDLEGNKNLTKTEINYIIRQKPRNFFFRSPQCDFSFPIQFPFYYHLYPSLRTSNEKLYLFLPLIIKDYAKE